MVFFCLKRPQKGARATFNSFRMLLIQIVTYQGWRKAIYHPSFQGFASTSDSISLFNPVTFNL